MGHLRNELLHHHIEHGPCRKAQKVRKRRNEERRSQNGRQSPHRLHHSGQNPPNESLGPIHPLRPKGHRNNGALRKILNGNAQGEGQSSGCRNLPISRQVSCIDYPHRHSLRNVMEGHCQHQHSVSLQAAFGPFSSGTISVQMGNEVIQKQQKRNAKPKPCCSRDKGPLPHTLRLLHSRKQQAPDGGRHHDPGGKAG